MGNGASKEELQGLRVTRVSPHSPAAATDLQPYTDFVVGVKDAPDSFRLDADFYKHVIEREGSTAVFFVFNLLTGTRRAVELRLSRDWPGADFLLGFKVRHESVDAARANMYRVSAVHAEQLRDRLAPGSDFLIAVAEFVFADLADLRRKLALYRACELVVFNLREERVRRVPIQYDAKRGIGFEVATGYLHDLSYLVASKRLRERQGRGDAERERLAEEPAEEVELSEVRVHGLLEERYAEALREVEEEVVREVK